MADATTDVKNNVQNTANSREKCPGLTQQPKSPTFFLFRAPNFCIEPFSNNLSLLHIFSIFSFQRPACYCLPFLSHKIPHLVFLACWTFVPFRAHQKSSTTIPILVLLFLISPRKSDIRTSIQESPEQDGHFPCDYSLCTFLHVATTSWFS